MTTPMCLTCKHSASFTCLLPTCLLKLFQFGSSLDKPGWQTEMHGGGSRGKRQTLYATWPKKPPRKELSKRKKLQSVTNLIQGQCHFARERECCAQQGMCTWGCLYRHAAKARADRELHKGINGNKAVHQESFPREPGPFFENWPCRRPGEDLGNFFMVTVETSRDSRGINRVSSQLRGRTVFGGPDRHPLGTAS